jgi:NitT/TauT family transport system substrate-binding protein
MMTKRRWVGKLRILVAVGALLVAACGDETGGDVEELDHIELQMKFSPTVMWGHYLYGIEEGIFERHGIDLELVPSTGSTFVMAQLNENRVQFANADMIGYLADRASTDSPTTAVMVVTDSPIFRILTTVPADSLDDLVGLKVAHNPFDVFRHVLPIVLELNGLARDAVQLEPVQLSSALLIEGAVDAMMVYVGSTLAIARAAAEAAGVTLYELDLADYGLVNYDHVILVRNEMLEDDPDLVRRMLSAIQESIEGAKAADDDLILDLLAPWMPGMNREVERIGWQEQKVYFGRTWTFDPAVVETVLGYIRDGLGIDHDLEAEDTFTNDFLP